MLGILNRYKRTIFSSFLFSLIALLGACGGGSSSSGGPSVTLSSLTITPQTKQFAVGTTEQFTATARYSNGATEDVSSRVNWLSAEESIASVNATGLASGLSKGKTTITASFQGKTASTATDGVTISDASMTELQISPQDTNIAKGLSKQYNATGIFSDGSHQDVSATVQWLSSKPSIATISASGLATSKAVGTSLISASLGNFTDSANLVVGAATLQQIEISPASAIIAKGLSKKFTATGAYSDGSRTDISNNVTWQSADTTLLAVDSSGLATAKAIGDPIALTATLNGVTASAAVEVSDAVLTGLAVSPATASIPKGRNQQFVATGSYSDGSTATITNAVNWTSADTSVIAIDSQGLASALKLASDTVITASTEGLNATAAMSVTPAVLDSVEVSPSNTTTPKGTSQQYTATAIYSDNSNLDVTTTATWLSSDRSVADISNVSGNQGFAIARTPGTVEISASLDGKKGQTELTVSEAELRAIQVTPNNKNLASGFQRQFTATGFYTDGSNKQINELVSWESSNSSIASIDNSEGKKGLVQAADTGTGTVSIRAFSGEISGFASLNINAASLQSITLSPTNELVAMDPDTRLPFSASGSFSDSTQLDITQQVTWSSSDDLIASISNVDGENGQATPVAVGSTEISATRNTISNKTTLTITAAVLEEITVTPASATVPAGQQKQYTATGSYSDNSTQDITQTVSWKTDDPSVSISNAAGSKGLATTTASAASKQIKISAAIGELSSNKANLIVTSAILDSIAITTQPAGINESPAGNEVQFIATGTLSDGSTSDLTQSSSWTVLEELPSETDANVGDISNTDGSKGLLSTYSKGTIKIGATSGEISAERDLTVTDAVLTGLNVSPQTAAIPLNTQQQFKATALYSDGSTSDVTAAADTAWLSSKTDVATVNNTNLKGLAISQGKSGSSDISASYLGETATGVLTVNPATLVSISLEDLSNLPVGATRQLTATGHYSDESSKDITSQVTWSSFSGNAIISNANDSRGLVTGVSVGTDVISAHLNGITASGELNVTEAVLASIEVSPKDTSAGGNSTVQYKATGIYTDNSSVDLTEQVTWGSSNTNVATISNAAEQKGLAQTKFQFTTAKTDISAVHTPSNIVGKTSLTVTAF